MVRRLPRAGPARRPPEEAVTLEDAVTLPAGFPHRLPGPPPGARLLGAAADASEDDRAATIVYTVRIACQAPTQDVRAHYLGALQHAGFEVTELPAGSDRFDVDTVLRYRGHECSGEVLVGADGPGTNVTLSATVARRPPPPA